jgi:hypothetical protein
LRQGATVHWDVRSTYLRALTHLAPMMTSATAAVTNAVFALGRVGQRLGPIIRATPTREHGARTAPVARVAAVEWLAGGARQALRPQSGGTAAERSGRRPAFLSFRFIPRS